jgi:hypothetical protein
MDADLRVIKLKIEQIADSNWGSASELLKPKLIMLW